MNHLSIKKGMNNRYRSLIHTMLILNLFLLSGSTIFGQVDKPKQTIDTLKPGMIADTVKVSESDDESDIFISVDEFPEFPGGTDAMNDYLIKKIFYPREALVDKAEGTVIVSFIVNTNGSISKIKVVKGIHKALDKVASDAVRGMPLWKAGKILGKAVRTQVNLPIRFMLPED